MQELPSLGLGITAETARSVMTPMLSWGRASVGRRVDSCTAHRVRTGPAWSAVVVIGVAIGVMTRVDRAITVASTVAALSIAVGVSGRAARRWCLLAALMCGAASYGVYARESALSSPLISWFNSTTSGQSDARLEAPARVRGRLARDGARNANDGVSLAIAVDHLLVDNEWQPIDGRVQASVSGDPSGRFVDDCAAGRWIEASVLLHESQPLRNPGGADPMWTALRRPADLVGTIKSASLVDIRPGSSISEATASIRRYVRRVVSGSITEASGQSAAIVTAILIGDRVGLDEEIQRRLQIAGTYHVIAISGGNIAILTTVCLVLLRLFIRSARAVTLITLVIVLVYGVIVGAEPSVERAVVAAAIYLSLGLVGLRPGALPTFFLVGAIVAVIDPLAVLDVGAWLSFGATLGIIVGATRAIHIATETRKAAGVLDRAWLAALGMLTATVTAELALVPVAAAVFSRKSASAGLVLNFVAIPAMSVAEIAGLALVVLHAWCAPLASVAAAAADVGARALVSSSKIVDVVPEVAWRTPPTWIGWTVAYYAGAMAALMTRSRSWPKRIGVVAAAVSLLVIVTAPGVETARQSNGWLRLTMIDVGQGDSILIQFPAGQSLLVDAGGVPGVFDIGGRVVMPALWASGVRRLDWLSVTHDDGDHIGGARSVLRDLDPLEVWEGVPVLRNAAWRDLRFDADRRGIVWRQVLAGQTWQVGSVLIQAMNPPLPDWERQKVRNDDSMALRLRFGDVEIVTTGDMGAEVEDRWPIESDAPPIRIVKVPHHGSRTSSSAGFLAKLRPQIALISVGAGNLFGHPAPDVLARYREIGADIFRTDQDGAIVLETDGAVVNMHTMSGREMRMAAGRQ